MISYADYFRGMTPQQVNPFNQRAATMGPESLGWRPKQTMGGAGGNQLPYTPEAFTDARPPSTPNAMQGRFQTLGPESLGWQRQYPSYGQYAQSQPPGAPRKGVKLHRIAYSKPPAIFYNSPTSSLGGPTAAPAPTFTPTYAPPSYSWGQPQYAPDARFIPAVPY